MSVDSVGPNPDAAAIVSARKREAEDAEASLLKQRSELERARRKTIDEEQELNDKSIVDISKQGETQAATLRKANQQALKDIDTHGQDHYKKVAESTAKELQNLDEDAAKKITAHNLSNMEKLRFLTTQSEDPFYRMKSLPVEMSDNAKEFLLKLKLPEYEAKNVFISNSQNKVNISLARSYEADAPVDKNETVRTKSYQTIVQTVAIPGPFDSKNITREYNDGALFIRIPKA